MNILEVCENNTHTSFLCVPPKIYFTEVILTNEEQTYLCSECGAAVTEEYLHEFDERILCSSCLDNPATICNCCGERIWRSDDEGDGNTDKSELIDYLKAKRLYVNEPITNPIETEVE